MSNVIGISLQFNADTSQAKARMRDLQTSLTNITKMTTMDSPGVKMASDLNKASLEAAKLKTSLAAAFNTNTGKLDLKNFEAALQKTGTNLAQLKTNLSLAGAEGQKAFSNLAVSLATAEAPAIRLNASMQKFIRQMAGVMRYQLSSSLFSAAVSALSQAYSYAQDLNESLNNIRIVTSYSAEEMERFAEKANKAAKALNTTTTAYTNASLIYFQQGLSMEEVQKRAEATIKLANVTGQSAETVSDQLTAVWNNFDNGTKSLEYYVDVLAALGAATASSTDEIAQGLEKFAAVAETVGLSYEYATAALATVTAQTRQSADVVGTAFKTLFARIQDLELGETLDDGTTLGSYSEALNKVGVNIKDANGDLKEMNVILDEMGAKWQYLDKDQQVALAKSVAGIRQYTQLIALMDNWDFFKQNVQTATNSTGTLNQQANIYAESWQAASDRVKASLEQIYSSLLDDDAFIDILNFLADFVDTISNVIDNLGGLKGVLLMISNIMLNTFNKQISSGLTDLIGKLTTFGNSIKHVYQTARGKEVQQDPNLQEQAASYAKDMYGKGTTGTIQSKNTDELIKANQKYMSVKDNLNEAEQRTIELLLEQQRTLHDNTIELQDQAKSAETVEKALRGNYSKGKDQESRKAIDNFSNTVRQKTAASATLSDRAVNNDFLSETMGISKNYKEAQKEVQNLKSYLQDLGITANNVEPEIKDAFGVQVSQAVKQYAADLEQVETKQNRIIELQNKSKQSGLSEEETTELKILNGEYDKTLLKLEELLAVRKTMPKNSAELNANTIALKNIQGQLKGTSTELERYVELKIKQSKSKGLNKAEAEELADLEAKTKSYSGTVKDLANSQNNLTQTMSLSDAEMQKLKAATGLTDAQLDALEQAAHAAGTSLAELLRGSNNLRNGLNGLNGQIDDFNNKPLQVGEYITAGAQLMTTFAMVTSSIQGMWDTLTRDDATFMEKLVSVAMTLGMVIPMVVSTFGQLNKVLTHNTTINGLNAAAEWLNAKMKERSARQTRKRAQATDQSEKELEQENQDLATNTILEKANQNVKKKGGKGKGGKAPKGQTPAPSTDVPADGGAGKATTLGGALKGLGSAIGGAIVPIAAVVGGIIVLVSAIALVTHTLTKSKKEMESAQKAAQLMAQATEEAKNKYDEFNTTVSNYKSGVEGLKELTKGTIEYQQAVFEANEAAIELLKTNSELKYTIGEGGVIEIDEDSLKKAQQKQLKQMQNMQASNLAAQTAADKATSNYEKEQFARKELSSSSGGWAHAGNIGGAMAAGAGAGALIGLIGGPAGAAIGAAIGAAVGAIGGAITTAISGTASGKEEQVLTDLAKYVQKNGNAVFASNQSLERVLRNELKIDDDTLINSLIENKEALIDLTTAEVERLNFERMRWQQGFLGVNADNTTLQNAQSQQFIATKGEQQSEQLLAQGRAKFDELLKGSDKDAADEYLKLIYGKEAENYRFKNLSGTHWTLEKRNEDGSWERQGDKNSISQDWLKEQFAQKWSQIEAGKSIESAAQELENLSKDLSNSGITDVTAQNKILEKYAESGNVNFAGWNVKDIFAIDTSKITDSKMREAVSKAKTEFMESAADVFSTTEFDSWYKQLSEKEAEILWKLNIDQEDNFEQVKAAFEVAREYWNSQKVLLNVGTAQTLKDFIQNDGIENSQTIKITDENGEEKELSGWEALYYLIEQSDIKNSEWGFMFDENGKLTADGKTMFTSWYSRDKNKFLNLLTGIESQGLAENYGSRQESEQELNQVQQWLKDNEATHNLEPKKEKQTELKKELDKYGVYATDTDGTKNASWNPLSGYYNADSQYTRMGSSIHFNIQRDMTGKISGISNDPRDPNDTRGESISLVHALLAPETKSQAVNWLNSHFEVNTEALGKHYGFDGNDIDALANFWFLLLTHDIGAVSSRLGLTQEQSEEILNSANQLFGGKSVGTVMLPFSKYNSKQTQYDNLTTEINEAEEAGFDDLWNTNQSRYNELASNRVSAAQSEHTQIQAIQSRNKFNGLDVEAIESYAVALKEVNKNLSYGGELNYAIATSAVQLNRGIQSLTESYEDWISKYESSPASPEGLEALKSLKVAISDIVGIPIEYIDEDFIKQHKEAIRKLLMGDISVIKDIELDASKVALDAALGQVTDGQLLKDVQQWLDNQNFEFGAQIDVDPTNFLGTMTEMLLKGKHTADELDAIFAGLNLKAKYTFEPDGSGIVTGITGFEWLGNYTDLLDMSLLNNDGSGSERKKKDLKDEIERYHEIEKTIENINHELDLLNKKKERAFGAQKISLIDDEIEKQKELLDLEEQYLAEIESNLATDKADIAGYGAVFDENGVITNYEELMKKYIDQYNSGAIDDEQYEAFKKSLSLYEETASLYRDKILENMDLKNEIFDKELEKASYSVEFNIELSDDSLKLIEYQLGRLEDSISDTTESLILLEQQTQQNIKKVETYQKGIRDTLAAGGQFTEEEINAILTGDMSVLEGKEITQEQMNQLNDYSNQLLDMNNILLEVYKTVEDKLISAFEKMNEEMDEEIDKIDHLNEIAQNYKDIIDLVGKKYLGIENDLLNNLDQVLVKTSQDKLRATNAKLQSDISSLKEAQAALDEARISGTEEQIKVLENTVKTLSEAVTEGESNLMDAWSTALEAAQQAFTDAVERVMETFEKAMTGIAGTFDALQEKYDQQSEINERYLEDYTKIYELSKLNRNISKTLNEKDNVIAKNKLRDIQEEINALQNSNNKITKYELDLLQAKYELRVAEIALEEAQKSKSQVRMQRDAEGNWGYVYTANQEQIDTALQGYEDKLYAMQQLMQNTQKELMEAIVALPKELSEAMQAIADDFNLSEKEKVKKWTEIQAYYADKQDYLVTRYQKVVTDSSELYEEDWQNYATATGYKISANEAWIDSFEESVYAQITGYNSLDEVQISFRNATKQMLVNLSYEYDVWQKNVDEANELAGISTQEFGAIVQEECQKITEESNLAADAVITLAAAGEEGFSGLVQAAAAYLEEYDLLISGYILKNTSLAGTITALKDAYSLLATEASKKVDFNVGNDKDDYYKVGADGKLKLPGYYTPYNYLQDSTLNAQAFVEGLGEQKDYRISLDENGYIDGRLQSVSTADGTYYILDNPSLETPFIMTAGQVHQGVASGFISGKQIIGTLPSNVNSEEREDLLRQDFVSKYSNQYRTTTTDGGMQYYFEDEHNKSNNQNIFNSINLPANAQFKVISNKTKKGYIQGNNKEIEFVRIEFLQDQLGGVEGAWAIQSSLTKDSEPITNDADYLAKLCGYKGGWNQVLSQYEQGKSFDTGGYTGAWDSSGRLAILHQKEIVLNAHDTANFLAAIDILRDITRIIDLNAMSQQMNLQALSSMSIGTNTQTVEQEVTIHAEFPNVTNHTEIEQAFDTLINRASQYAFRN